MLRSILWIELASSAACWWTAW